MKSEIAKSIEAAQESLEAAIYAFRNSVDNSICGTLYLHYQTMSEILRPVHNELLAQSTDCMHLKGLRSKLNQAMTNTAKAHTWAELQAERGSDFYHFNDIIDNYYCEAKAQLAIAKAHCEFIEV